MDPLEALLEAWAEAQKRMMRAKLAFARTNDFDYRNEELKHWEEVQKLESALKAYCGVESI